MSSSAGGLRPLLRWQLAAASLGAAAIHFAVIVPHFNEYTPFGIFFLVVAWFQATWALLVAIADDRRLLLAGVVVNAVVVLVWIWSRTTGLPIGPESGVAEEVGAPDGISTSLEAVIIVWTTLLLTHLYRWRQPSRRFAVGAGSMPFRSPASTRTWPASRDLNCLSADAWREPGLGTVVAPGG